jgi:hypothetical protein
MLFSSSSFSGNSSDKLRRISLQNRFNLSDILSKPKLPHIESFCKALKMSWLYKLLDPMNMSPWKILLLSYIEKYGGDKILYLKKEGLESISDKLNLFWFFHPFGLHPQYHNILESLYLSYICFEIPDMTKPVYLQR